MYQKGEKQLPAVWTPEKAIKPVENAKKNLKTAGWLAKGKWALGGLMIGAGIGLGAFIADTIYDEGKE